MFDSKLANIRLSIFVAKCASKYESSHMYIDGYSQRETKLQDSTDNNRQVQTASGFIISSGIDISKTFKVKVK